MKRAVTDRELAQPLLPYAEAVRLVIDSFSPLETHNVALDDALGLVAAEDVTSTIDVPGFASSAMDGYAVCAADVTSVPVSLPVVAELPAGAGPRAHERGTAPTIMTGGPLPAGADAIVPWEDTDRGEDVVTINATAKPGNHVRPAGEDVHSGDRAVTKGDELSAVRLGVLASIGRTSVAVHRRPRVAVLSTGDEIARPGTPLLPGHVYDANSTLIAGLLRSAGAHVLDVATTPDDPDAIASWLANAASRADLIVTTGGASVGSHDWLRDVLEREGELTMWRVAVKPGKPVALGRIGGTAVLVLPGNPGSAFASMHCFVIPAVRRMLGRDPAHPSVRTKLGAAVKG
ncbi:MAG: molybdopterin molybdotransferase MoeA, partial [Actinobacteria bacterium]|nr:molybdopterin molybdotransferase MoeA [Actinomycetota bacterium]